MGDNLAWCGNRRKELLARTTTAFFLIQNRLAQFNALTADVDIARSFNQWPHIPVAFATEGTEGIFFGRSTSTTAPEIGYIFP